MYHAHDGSYSHKSRFQYTQKIQQPRLGTHPFRSPNYSPVSTGRPNKSISDLGNHN